MVKTVTITTLIGCPIRCFYCPQDLIYKHYKSQKRRMTLDDFKRYIDTIPPNIWIDFSGFSEPFLNKDCVDMVLYAASRGHGISVASTCIGMTKADIDRLKDVKFEIFVLHLPDAEGYTRIPVTDAHLELVTYLKETATHLNLQYMSMGTIHPKFVGVFPQEESYPNPFAEISRLGTYTFAKVPKNYGSIDCSYGGGLTEHLFLLPDGRVVLCCQDLLCQFVLGNLNEISYAELTQSPTLVAIRKNLKKWWDNTSLCRRCEKARPTLPFFFLNFNFLKNYFKIRIINKKLLKKSISKISKLWNSKLR